MRPDSGNMDPNMGVRMENDYGFRCIGQSVFIERVDLSVNRLKRASWDARLFFGNDADFFLDNKDSF